jgi:hypothetical protein
MKRIVSIALTCYFILEKASGRMVSVFMPQKEDVPATENR